MWEEGEHRIYHIKRLYRGVKSIRQRFLSFFHVVLHLFLCILAVPKRNKLSMKKSNNFTQLHQQIMLFSGRNCCREKERERNSNQFATGVHCLEVKCVSRDDDDYSIFRRRIPTQTSSSFRRLSLSSLFFYTTRVEGKEPLFLHLRKT